jgi:hypothetical protein
MIFQAGILICDACGSNLLIPIVASQKGDQIGIALPRGLPPGWVPSQIQPGVVTCSVCTAKASDVEAAEPLVRLES